MKLILTASTFLLFCAAVFTEVNACTCLDYGVPTCALFSRADAVFVGKIERITSAMGDKDSSVQLGGVGSISSRGGGLIWVHFNIERGFKGVSGETVKALTYSGTSCDLGVKEGERWLIFAQRDKETSNLSFGACDGNGEIEKNSPLIAELEKLSKRVETDPWGDKVECGMAKVDISSQPADPIRIVMDRKGRCDEKAFAKMFDAGIKK